MPYCAANYASVALYGLLAYAKHIRVIYNKYINLVQNVEYPEYLRNSLQSGGPVSNPSIIRAASRLIEVASIPPATLQDPTLDSVLARNNLQLGLYSAARVDDYIVVILLAYVQHIQRIDTCQLRNVHCGYIDAEQVPLRRLDRTFRTED